MPRRSRYDKRDQNEKDILKELAKIPSISIQEGHDDVLIGYRGLTYWFEIKNPSELLKDGSLAHKNRKTEKKQIDLAENWKGHYQIVSTLEEILIAIGVIK